MPDLNAKWSYRSFCPSAARPRTEEVPAIPPQIAAPWTPLAVMDLTTAGGKVTGTATVRPGVALQVHGTVTPRVVTVPGGDEVLPEGVELVVDGLAGAVYNLRGFFTPGSDHVVGTVVAICKDLGGQPAGTSGPFILFPLKSE